MEQDLQELAWLKGKISGVKSILEIGCRYGDSLRELASAAAPGAKIRAIDHGMPSGECPNPTVKELRHAIKWLKVEGFDAECYIGDSHDEDTLAWATKNGPYDFIYIDADHSYEGVKADYEQYGPLARMVGLHDIAHAPNAGPTRLWQEIVRNGVRTQECISSGMGTGLVMRD
jgi:predicted O-methyltransferase YrrM